MSDLVGLNTQVPNFTQTMSGLMSLKQQKQQLDQGAANLQMIQQDASQRKALANIDWDKHTGEDGTLDVNSFVKDNDIRKAAGDSYPQLLAQAAQIKSAQVDAKSRMLNLTNDQVSSYGKVMNSVAGLEDVKKGTPEGMDIVKNVHNEFRQVYGDEAAKAVAPFAMALHQGKVPPEKLEPMVRHIGMMAMDVSSQLDKTKPSGPMVQGQNGLEMQNTNAYAPGGIAPPVKQGIAPTIITAPNSQISTLTNNGQNLTPVGGQPSQRSTGLLNPDGHPRTASQDAPPPNAPQAVQEGYNKAVTAANDHVQNVRDADEHYRTNVDISNKIRDLSRTTATGPAMAWIKEKVGASDFQELGAYLDRQAAGLQTAMNLPHTNQGQEAARDISGNTKYTPKAIQEKNDFNQSLVEGFHAYRKGLERVGGLSGNGSPAAINQFKAAWADSFDPNVFRAKAAYSRKAEEGTAFVKSLSPQDAAKMLDDKKKIDMLMQGKLPE